MYIYLSYFLCIISYDNNIKKKIHGWSIYGKGIVLFLLLKVNINYNMIKN